MIDKVKLKEFQGVYNEIRNVDYNQQAYKKASEAIETLDLDDAAMDSLYSRISTNADAAKNGEFLNRENINTSGVWTEGQLSFVDRGDGTYLIQKTDENGVTHNMGFTDKEGVDSYYSIGGEMNKKSAEEAAVEAGRERVRVRAQAEIQKEVAEQNKIIEDAIESGKERERVRAQAEIQKEVAEQNKTIENAIESGKEREKLRKRAEQLEVINTFDFI